MTRYLNLFYIIILSVLIVSCEKTLNETDLEFAFIDAKSEIANLTSYNYYDTISTTIAYYEPFNNTNGIWKTGLDEYASRYIEDGEYEFEAYKSFYTWNELPYNSSKDFQIDAVLTPYFSSWSEVEKIGVVFGVNTSLESKPHIAFYIKKNADGFTLIVHDGFIENEIYNVALPQFSDGEPELFTIRKVGGNISFFFNKQFLNYKQLNMGNTNFGFTISKRCTLYVGEISVKYLD